ncbi:ComF family protein [Marinobacterium weihaiense]|uniref:ComF family protein n=1 Tax=Marinobacterium weihaiense TaxID=2851016 RepID=A0ABS6MAX3_9GAMM|nr:ComF family protein [Marinobacterium weihaiense]MBV0933444.1 ComF family protein [Marinobacterium weihaiense]
MSSQQINSWIKNKQICALCSIRGADHHGLCAGCHADLPWLLHYCRSCALPLPLSASPGSLCGHCIRQPPAFDRTLAAFEYDFPLSQLLPTIKYHRQPAQLGWLGRVLADYIRDRQDGDWPEVLVPVPMHTLSEFKRGFNQARLLTQVLGRSLHLPLAEPVRKVRRTPHQMALSLEDRCQNLQQAFAVHARPPRHLALVDDVMTTGTTVNTLAQALKAAGAERVDVWVLARTAEVR